MIIDGHIHIDDKQVKSDDLNEKLKLAGVDGGVILSLPPATHSKKGWPYTYVERMDNLSAWTESSPNLFPFFWIDPTEENAAQQVELAVKRGVAGFKIICSFFYPGDKRAVETYRIIAKTGKPILFHSGILWDGKISSAFNRPAQFEALLDIDGLKFTLAHVSWPWCDENIAVYGKFLNAYSKRPGLSVEMFIDITPGTPVIYRDEVLTKLFTVGYDVADNIIFGTDCHTGNYNVKWAREWIERDNGIYGKLGLGQDTIDKIYSGNLKRLLGITSQKVNRRTPKSGE